MKMKNLLNCVAGFGLLAGGLVSQAVFAQEAAVIEEILVTARKTEEGLSDAPITVSAFDSSALETLDINSVNDIARFSPGLSFSSAFGRATERPVIRGQGNILAGVQFGVESGVAYFVDGVYYNGDIQSLDMSNLERVEVIKGPQSALYGRNTYSGAINFVTRGIPDKWTGGVNVQMLEDGEENIRANIGGPIIDGVLGAQLSLRGYSFDGQWKNQVTNRDVGDEETKSINLALEWTPSDNMSMRFRAQRTEDEDGTRPFFLQSATQNNCFPGHRSLAFWAMTESTNPNQYFCGEIKSAPIALNDGPDADGVPNVIPGLQEGSTFFGTLYNPAQGVAFSGVERELDYYSLAADYTFDNDYRLVFQTGYRDEERKTGSDSDHGPINFIFFPGAESFFGNTGIDEYEEKSYEIRLESSMENSIRWSVGAFYYDYEQDASDITFSGLTPDGTDNSIENTAYFASVTWDVADNLSISLEGRYADEEKSQKDYDAAGVLEFSGDENFKSFAPRLTVDWQINDDTLIYGIYSEGIKPGGLNGAVGVGVNTPGYDEEESKNYEIGLKKTLWEGRVQASLAYYYTDITQYQLTTPVASPTGALNSVVTNQGDGEVSGVEVDIKAALSANATVGFTYALADSEFTKGCDDFQWTLTSGGGVWTGDIATSSNPNGNGNCSIKGHQFPMGSKHQTSFYLDWGYPIGDTGLEFFGNVNLSKESKRYTQVHQQSYTGATTIVGARIGIGGENWSAAFIGRNMNNENAAVLATRWLQVPYLTFTSLNVAPATSDRSLPRAFFALPRRERQYGFEFTARF